MTPWLTLLAALLATITICMVALTLATLRMARSVRVTLYRLDRVLVKSDRVLQQTHAVAQSVSQPLLAAIAQIERWRHQTETWWTGVVGNGAGAEPRSHHRKG